MNLNYYFTRITKSIIGLPVVKLEGAFFKMAEQLTRTTRISRKMKDLGLLTSHL